jgi:hypothetical protein
VKTQLPTGTLLPSGVLRGEQHGPTFRTDHKRAAQNDAVHCQSCHRQEFCLKCHNNVVKPFDFHGGDYVTLHQIDARKNDPNCSACHRLQTFCVGCHQRSGVALDNPGGDVPVQPRAFGSGRLQFHPTGWVYFNGTTSPNGRDDPNHHSFQAQRNIRACASCHREETCLRCHTSARVASPPGLRVTNMSPHGVPGTFRGSSRCQALLARNRRSCVKCHTGEDANSCDHN